MVNALKILVLITLLGYLFPLPLFSQDAQLTQFFASPIYTNPALAGSLGTTRYGLNYRRQWPSIPGGFSTYMASFDTYISAINSGVAFQVFRDIAKNSQLSTSFISCTYAYGVSFNDKLQIRFAVSALSTLLSIDQSKLVFKDQIINQTERSTIENSISNYKYYTDFSFATLASYKKIWIGLNIDHLLQPNQSLLNVQSRLSRKYSVYGGFRYTTNFKTFEGYDESSTFSFLYLYNHQGSFDQLNLGLNYQDLGFIIGGFFKGIPFIKTNADNSINYDAISILLGYKNKKMYYGYTYDLTISKLRSNTGGSHEIAIIYILKNKLMPKRISNSPHPPKCPEF